MITTTVLFICSGNIYRSRYAEAYLNHIAEQRNLPVRAISRGLTINADKRDIAPETTERMKVKGIKLSLTADRKKELLEEDLENADYIIALKEAEHRPMLIKQFPKWTETIAYWHISDVGEWSSEKALPEIEQHVSELLDSIMQPVI